MSYATPKICIKCKYNKREYIKDNVYMSTCTAEGECPMIKRKVVVNDDSERKVIEGM